MHNTKIIFTIIGFFYLSLISCASVSFGRKGNEKEIVKMTQLAIFEYMNSPYLYPDQTFSKGLIQIDPSLHIRDSIVMNNTTYFNKPMDSEEIKHPVSKKTYKLAIPGSFAGKFEYAEPKSNYANNYSTIYEFSPLIPTTKTDLYLIETYVWSNVCGNEQDTLCCRTAHRFYLKFKVKNHKISFIESISPTDKSSDFIGLPCFSRQKLTSSN